LLENSHEKTSSPGFVYDNEIEVISFLYIDIQYEVRKEVKQNDYETIK
jgi:hypothetical protein